MGDLILSQIHKRFGEQVVLDGLDLEVPSGSFAALLGPSGVGKTTLLRLLAGFDRPDAGTISVGGLTVAGEHVHVRPERRRIGYVPQEGSLFPHLTVAGNIGFGLPRAQRSSRVAELLAIVGLDGLQRRYPHQLSGGQQQRVALARALAISPELVLLDEPFAALDASLRSDLRDEVRRILGHAGATALLVTHNQDEALSSADLVAVLRDGRIVQRATPSELYMRPVDDRLAAFIGAANLIDGVVEDAERVRTPIGVVNARWHDVQPAPASPVTVLIRPEQLRVAASDDRAAVNGTHAASHGRRAATNGHRAVADGGGVAAEVLRCSFHGHDTVLHVKLAGCDAEILVRSLGGAALAPGDACVLTASGSALVWPRAVSSGVARESVSR